MANKQKQMLAVWGSPGAGKTVTAVKLAAELAKRKKNVVLVFTDLTAPSLPAVAAEGKLPEVSVGDLLSAPGMTQERVLKTCVPCEKHPYISFLGYKAGENVFTYAEYSKEKAVDMLVREHEQHPDNPILFPSPRTGGYWSPDAVSRINRKLPGEGGH